MSSWGNWISWCTLLTQRHVISTQHVGYHYCYRYIFILNVFAVAIGTMMLMIVYLDSLGVCVCQRIMHNDMYYISITCSCFSWIWTSTIEVFRNAGISIDSSGAKEDLWCVVSSIHDTVVAPSVIVVTARFRFDCWILLRVMCMLCIPYSQLFFLTSTLLLGCAFLTEDFCVRGDSVVRVIWTEKIVSVSKMNR